MTPTMSNIRYVPACQSGCKRTDEKLSLFRFPTNADLRDEWKQAIGFTFDWKYVRMCEKHVDGEDVILADGTVSLCRCNVSVPNSKDTSFL